MVARQGFGRPQPYNDVSEKQARLHIAINVFLIVCDPQCVPLCGGGDEMGHDPTFFHTLPEYVGM